MNCFCTALVCKFKSFLLPGMKSPYQNMQRTRYNQKKEYHSSLPCSFPFEKVVALLPASFPTFPFNMLLFFHSYDLSLEFQLNVKSRKDASNAKSAMKNGFGLASNLSLYQS